MKKFLALLAAAAMTLVSVSAFAAYDMKIDDDTFGKVAIAAQFQFSSSNPGIDKLGTKTADSAISFSGQITNVVKFGLSYGFGTDATTNPTAATAAAPTTSAKVKDVLIMFDLAKEFKVNVGIYRTAVSRVALQDTYQIILIDNPDVAGASFISAGGLASYRNAGVTIWGDLLDGMLRYNVGVFDGAYSPAGPSTEIGYNGRLVLQFMDPEKGYTCGECYLGKAKVANVGFGYAQVENTAKTQTNKVMTADAFYDASNLTLEGAYFVYDADLASGVKPTGWFAEAAYLFGKIQPAVRYESWDADVAANDNGDYENIVLGVNYLISGLDARVSLQYKMKDFDGTGLDVDTATAQFQVRF